jgi:hypothetical protein
MSRSQPAGGRPEKWEEVGGVEIDSATCGFGEPGDFDRLGAELGWVLTGPHDAAVLTPDGLAVAVCGTGADMGLPVEVLRDTGGSVVAARMAFVDDLDDLDGRWDQVGELQIDARCEADDPYGSEEVYRLCFDLPPGTYRAEVFRPSGSDWDCLALRIVSTSSRLGQR